MSIVFSAITPHPLILIPQIGKDNIEQLRITSNSFLKLKDALKKSGATTIVLISPHGAIQNESFSINLNPEFEYNFEEFGDFATRATAKGNLGLISTIKESLETKVSLQLMSDNTLDHGVSVPYSLLTDEKDSYKLMPIYYSGLEPEDHFNFGQLLKQDLQNTNERIAIIASGDLSHRLDKNAPGGYSPRAKKFDTRIIKYIQEKNTKALLEMDRGLILEAGECGLKSILILLGIMDGIMYTPKQLSYEHPFGVGYLCINMLI